MKRCPQCHFIYEDDQSHCDMDGTRLRHDSRTLPLLQTATIPEESNRPKWRSRVLAAPAATMLAGVLALVYYVSTHQPSPRATTVTTPAAAEATVETSESVPASAEGETTSKPEAKQQELQSLNDVVSDPGSSTTASTAEPKTEAKPVNKTEEPDPKPQTKNSERSATPDKPKEKEESKVRSMFNKTKRFFKKNLPL